MTGDGSNIASAISTFGLVFALFGLALTVGVNNVARQIRELKEELRYTLPRNRVER